MESIIELIKENLLISRILWFGSGILGYFIFKKNRPSFYANRSTVWTMIMWLFYVPLGPAVFLFSLFTFFNPEKKWGVLNEGEPQVYEGKVVIGTVPPNGTTKKPVNSLNEAKEIAKEYEERKN